MTLDNPPRHGEVAARSADGGGLPFTRKRSVYAARKLRADMSMPEVLLWQHLRGSPQGMRFRRQHPIGPYVVDFYCSVARTAFEIDGQSHDHSDRPARDVRRDAFLTENGHRIVRIAAGEVLHDAGAVAEAIIALAGNPLHHPAGGPPPRAGEDF